MLREFLENKRKKELTDKIVSERNRLKETYIDENVFTTSKNKDVCLMNSLLCTTDNENISFYMIRIFDYKDYIGKVNYSIEISDNKKCLYICDINLVDKRVNEGIGTEIIRYLERIASKNKLKYISGELAEVDLSDHGDRLLHYYMKNGFEIKDKKIYKYFN